MQLMPRTARQYEARIHTTREQYRAGRKSQQAVEGICIPPPSRHITPARQRCAGSGDSALRRDTGDVAKILSFWAGRAPLAPGPSWNFAVARHGCWRDRRGNYAADSEARLRHDFTPGTSRPFASQANRLTGGNLMPRAARSPAMSFSSSIRNLRPAQGGMPLVQSINQLRHQV